MVSGIFIIVLGFNTNALAGDGHSHMEKYKTDSTPAADFRKDYPLETCVVSGMKLGSMGDTIVYTYKGQEIRLCCKGCLETVKKNPEKYLKIVKDAYDGKK